MGRRRGVRRLAAFWLTCQMVSVVLVPIALHAQVLPVLNVLNDLNDPGTHPIVCTCTDDAPNAACPVHHGHTAGHTTGHSTPKSGSKVCFMRSGTDTPTAVLTSLFTVVGLVSEVSPIIAPSSFTSIASRDVSISFERPVPPDPPPPRV